MLGERCLLIAHGHTGNNIFCTPAINLLKKHYPNTQIDIVVLNKKSAEVFVGNTNLKKIYIMRYRWQLKRICRNYGTVICLNYKSRQLIEHIPNNTFVVSRVPPYKHHADHILEQLAFHLRVDIQPSDRQYSISPSERSLTSVIGEKQLESNDILIGMHMGCARTAIHGWKAIFKQEVSHQKLWSIEKYIDLAKVLISHNQNIRFFITGTRNERYLGEMFESEINRTINLIGKTHLTDLPVILNKASAFITQDCGMLHAAGATTVPLIALFGPTSWVNTGPYPQSRKGVVIAKSSMDEITSVEVAEATLAVINQKLIHFSPLLSQEHSHHHYQAA